MLDYYAIGIATYPMTMAEYYSMQEQNINRQAPISDDDEPINLDEPVKTAQ